MTSESKGSVPGGFTPGPWEIDANGELRGANGRMVYERRSGIAQRLGGNEDAEALANGRLRNAAPDLLEALQRIADAPAWGAPEKWETTPFEVRQLARAAIAKATGQ